MKNTTINEADRLYIIAFGDSRKYLLPAKENEDAVTNLERELNEYLSSRFPGENFAYFTTPEITEVDKADAPDCQTECRRPLPFLPCRTPLPPDSD